MHPMTFRSLETADLVGKRALVRVDFNVPLAEKDGAMVITDARIMSIAAKYFILASSFGQPKGRPPRYL